MIGLIGVLFLCIVILQKVLPTDSSDSATANESVLPTEFYPTIKNGVLIEHGHFALSYVERYEIAEWVAYELSIDHLNAPKVKRAERFYPDQAVRSRSADHSDYTRSGYTRGHLVPAADRAYAADAMQETFLMSNITPQLKAFNGGVWRELEEQTRDWARRFRHLYVVSGPVMTGIRDYIGDDRVGVPKYFYKVLLDDREPERKGIGFIIPNALSVDRLESYAVSIDSVERLTGLDFFAGFQSTQIEKLERDFDPQAWSYNTKRYHLRVEKWNRY